MKQYLTTHTIILQKIKDYTPVDYYYVKEFNYDDLENAIAELIEYERSLTPHLNAEPPLRTYKANGYIDVIAVDIYSRQVCLSVIGNTQFMTDIKNRDYFCIVPRKDN